MYNLQNKTIHLNESFSPRSKYACMWTSKLTGYNFSTIVSTSIKLLFSSSSRIIKEGSVLLIHYLMAIYLFDADFIPRSKITVLLFTQFTLFPKLLLLILLLLFQPLLQTFLRFESIIMSDILIIINSVL